MAKFFGKKVSNEEFITQFGEAAVKNFSSSKILPSLIICQAIVGSSWGTLNCATRHNNYTSIQWNSDSFINTYNHFTRTYTIQYDEEKTKIASKEYCEFIDMEEGIDCMYKYYLQDNEYCKLLPNSIDAYSNFENIAKSGFGNEEYIKALEEVYSSNPKIKEFDDFVLGARPIKITASQIKNFIVGDEITISDFEIKVYLSNGEIIENPLECTISTDEITSPKEEITFYYEDISSTLEVAAEYAQTYLIQVGAYGKQVNADKMVIDLFSKGYMAYNKQINNFWRVLISAKSEEERNSLILQLIKDGYNPCKV